MKIQIMHRFETRVLFECEADSLKIAIEMAVKQKINLSGADLSRANLKDVKNGELALAHFQFIPTEGSFIGWKKCQNGVIVRLLIPKDAKRSNGSERKCRASKVVVLEIFNGIQGLSQYDSSVVYRAGEIVVPDSFDENRWNTCSHGVHFYLTRIEAENN